MLNLRLQIRPAERFEAVKIRELNDACGLGRWPAGDYAAAMSLRDFALEVALSERHIVGFYLARLAGPDLELLKLGVDPSRRRHGIGGALLKACLGWGKRAVCESCFLEVRTSNSAAIRLYEQFGFRQTGLRRAYYHDPVEDALVMSRDLRIQQSAGMEG